MTRDRYAHLDEESIPDRRQRPTRPRTKQRPGHADALPAVVVAVDRGRYRCVPLGDDPSWQVMSAVPEAVTAMRARELARSAIVVGDEAWLVGDTSGSPGTLARIVRVEPRRSVLRRSADDDDPSERVIVANVDQMAIVVAVTDPPPRFGLIDRCLVAALHGGIDAALVVTKTDLGDPATVAEPYRALGIRSVTASRDADLGAVSDLLAGHRTVLVGHSGVGKSSLVNRLVPDADRRVGAVNDITGRGRHTSSSALAIPLPGLSGWIVDTPGIRSFGLGHVAVDDVLAAFLDLADGAHECPRSCSHDEPECALDGWVAAGNATQERLDSLRRLLRSMR